MGARRMISRVKIIAAISCEVFVGISGEEVPASTFDTRGGRPGVPHQYQLDKLAVADAEQLDVKAAAGTRVLARA